MSEIRRHAGGRRIGQTVVASLQDPADASGGRLVGENEGDVGGEIGGTADCLEIGPEPRTVGIERDPGSGLDDREGERDHIAAVIHGAEGTGWFSPGLLGIYQLKTTLGAEHDVSR